MPTSARDYTRICNVTFNPIRMIAGTISKQFRGHRMRHMGSLLNITSNATSQARMLLLPPAEFAPMDVLYVIICSERCNVPVAERKSLSPQGRVCLPGCVMCTHLFRKIQCLSLTGTLVGITSRPCWLQQYKNTPIGPFPPHLTSQDVTFFCKCWEMPC